MPKVWNKRDPQVPPDAVYVGRPTKWGNPFTHVRNRSTIARWRVESRDEAITKFIVWVLQPHQAGLRAAARQELRDRDLICWCAPLPCHAHTWMIIAASASDAELNGALFGLPDWPTPWLQGAPPAR
jgi:hypothetical protein